MKMSIWGIGGMVLTGESRSTVKKLIFVHHVSYRDCAGIELKPSHCRPVTNILILDTESMQFI